jgi:hypothetical protein
MLTVVESTTCYSTKYGEKSQIGQGGLCDLSDDALDTD